MQIRFRMTPDSWLPDNANYSNLGEAKVCDEFVMDAEVRGLGDMFPPAFINAVLLRLGNTVNMHVFKILWLLWGWVRWPGKAVWKSLGNKFVWLIIRWAEKAVDMSRRKVGEM